MSTALLISTANAQTADDEQSGNFDQVIVTAKKIEQTIYEAPVAITAFGTEDLAKRNATNLVDIGKYVPNMTVTTFGAGSTSSQFPSIRGIGFQDHLIVVDPTVGVYVDGVYLGRQIGQNLGLTNIERIEVLRGPQGTLFGRNSVGGAVNIITKQPGSEETATINLQAGTRGRIIANAYGNTKLNDTVAVSANMGVNRRNGIGDFINIPNPEAQVGELEDISGRVALKWTPTDRFSLLLSADGNTTSGGLAPYTTNIIGPAGGCSAAQLADAFGPFAPFCFGGLSNADQAADPYDNATGQNDLTRTESDAYGFSAVAELEVSEAVALKFIGSYRKSSFEAGLDDDGTAVDFLSFPENGEAEQYSLEAQVSGKSGRVDYVGGVYYFEEEGFNFQFPTTFNSFGGGTFNQFQDTSSFAVYGNVGFQVTDELRVTGGLRYSDDHKDATAFLGFIPEFGGEADFDELSWEASASYELEENLNVFATVARGYQSGQFPARPFGGPDTFIATPPVIATNYEAGIKGEPVDWLQMGLSVFLTRYEAFPAQVSTIGPNGFITVTDAAGDLKSFGVEWEGNIRFGGFELNSAIGYIDAEFENVAAGSSIQDGDRPALTPEWTVAIAPQYTVDVGHGEVVARVDYSYRGDIEGQPNNVASAFIESRDLFGFDLTYRNHEADWSAGVYGKNVGDERYTQGALDVGPYVLNILSNDASEFGVKFSKTFGGN
jgi:iron complex outermembrane receptor protein